MELRQLVHFVAVAEEGSFTRGARRVNIAQSGISTSIAALERAVGVALFLRKSGGAELTNAGHAFLIEARRALAAVDAAGPAARRASRSLSGPLTVHTAGKTAVQLPLAAAIDAFRAAHPNVQLAVREVPLVDVNALLDGAADVLIGPTQAVHGFVSIMLSRCPVGGCEISAHFDEKGPRAAAARAFIDLCVRS